jgi:type IV secretory pathway TrbF-like protein
MNKSEAEAGLEEKDLLQKQDAYRLYLRSFTTTVTRVTPDPLPEVHNGRLKAIAFGAMDAEAFLKDPAAAYTDRDPSFADSAAPVSLPVGIETLWKRVQG